MLEISGGAAGAKGAGALFPRSLSPGASHHGVRSAQCVATFTAAVSQQLSQALQLISYERVQPSWHRLFFVLARQLLPGEAVDVPTRTVSDETVVFPRLATGGKLFQPTLAVQTNANCARWRSCLLCHVTQLFCASRG
jgi:hypothetical protein